MCWEAYSGTVAVIGVVPSYLVYVGLFLFEGKEYDPNFLCKFH